MLNTQRKRRHLYASAAVLAVGFCHLASAKTFKAQSLHQLVRSASVIAVIHVPADAHRQDIAADNKTQRWPFGISTSIKADSKRRAGQFVCDTPGDDSDHLLHADSTMLLFGRWTGSCYEPIRGFRGSMQIHDGKVDTLGDHGKPDSIPIDVYVRRLQEILAKDSAPSR